MLKIKMAKLKKHLLVEQYLFLVKRRLLYSRKRKKSIINNFREFINSCIEEENETVNCKEDLYNLFGTVDKAAKNFMDLRDNSEIDDFEKDRKRKFVLISGIVILVISFIFLLIWIITSNSKVIDNTEIITFESYSSYEEVNP